MRRIEVVVLTGLLALGGAFGSVALHAQDDPRKRVTCQNHLRQLALAAIQYADDKRFFPHATGAAEVDGGVETNHATRIARALVFFDYLDDPAGFVCPSSPDRPAAVPAAVQADMRSWFWGGRQVQATLSPLGDPNAEDPTLQACTELSYGWSRRMLRGSSAARTALAADRSGEHHGGQWNVARCDGTVGSERTSGTPSLTGVGAGEGALGIEERRSRAQAPRRSGGR